MKLSEAQKGVIKCLRTGWNIFIWNNEVKGKYGQTVYKARAFCMKSGEESIDITGPTLRGLILKRLISSKPPYVLTELGKTVEL